MSCQKNPHPPITSYYASRRKKNGIVVPQPYIRDNMNDILTSNKRPALLFEFHSNAGETFKKAKMKNAFFENVAARKEHWIF